ncbi:hypothetical protein [Streptomyces sp. CA-132043]|uniref:hypothetical protein n=1 Tax=Streptomyces sp. CA-132043 TaxID=3240048 RepID=UPI003D9423CC
MDPEIATLAGTAGTTLVTLMATEAWQGVRDGVVGLWRRARPDRADAVSAELEAAREDLLAARDSADEETEEELRRDWQGRIRRLLAARPDVADDLRALLDEVSPGAAPAAPVITQHATASGSARVYQAGRDQHIHER